MSTKRLKISKRTSSPIEDTEFLDPLRSCPIYEDWKIYLHLAPSRNLKVRGLKNPPKGLISGFINFNKEPKPVVEKPVNLTEELDKKIECNADVEDEALDNEVENAFNTAITCSTYAKQIEVRNNGIKDKIIPMLQKGLKKLCISKIKSASRKLGAKHNESDFVELDRDESIGMQDSYLLILH